MRTKIINTLFSKSKVLARPSLKPFHEFKYGSEDGSQRGIILSSGKEWSEQRKFCLRKLTELGIGKSSKINILISNEAEKLCTVLSKKIEGRVYFTFYIYKRLCTFRIYIHKKKTEYRANCNSLIITIFHSTNTDQGHNGQLRLSLQYELNISIVNALWVFLTGELLSLHDNKLKVTCLKIKV